MVRIPPITNYQPNQPSGLTPQEKIYIKNLSNALSELNGALMQLKEDPNNPVLQDKVNTELLNLKGCMDLTKNDPKLQLIESQVFSKTGLNDDMDMHLGAHGTSLSSLLNGTSNDFTGWIKGFAKLPDPYHFMADMNKAAIVFNNLI